MFCICQHKMTLWHKHYRLYNAIGFELLCFGFPHCVYAVKGDLSLCSRSHASAKRDAFMAGILKI